jgi:hypothetical protein
LSGQRDSTPALWAILMFQSWLEAETQEVAHAQVQDPVSSTASVLSA